MQTCKKGEPVDRFGSYSCNIANVSITNELKTYSTVLHFKEQECVNNWQTHFVT
jgi:hypothetical protein